MPLVQQAHCRGQRVNSRHMPGHPCSLDDKMPYQGMCARAPGPNWIWCEEPCGAVEVLSDWSAPPYLATCRCLSQATLPDCILSSRPSVVAVAPVYMTTRALEELDRGLGSCLASEDLSALADPCPGRPPGDKPPETPGLGNSSTWLQDSQEAVAVGNVATKPKKMEKEPVVRGSPGAGKEKLKSGATPRSVPARKKAQPVPPPQPPPLPPVLSEELPWGDVSLNKCLVLACLVALLGSAFQLCRDTVIGEGTAPTLVPEPWVPRSSPPKEPASSLVSPPVAAVGRSPAPRAAHGQPAAWAPRSGPPAPQAGPPAIQGKAEDSPEVPLTKEAAEKAPGEPGEATREAAGEKHVPLVDRGPKERSRKEERPPKEKTRKEKPRKVERPLKERPRAAREAREGGHRPWAQDPRDTEHREKQAWATRRRPRGEKDRHPGRPKHRAGKGRGSAGRGS